MAFVPLRIGRGAGLAGRAVLGREALVHAARIIRRVGRAGVHALGEVEVRCGFLARIFGGVGIGSNVKRPVGMGMNPPGRNIQMAVKAGAGSGV
ncbi:hypothetical protein D3C78_1209460 [compost metagenome]